MRKNPEKTSPRKLVPTGDRTRARCVTGAHATPCPTVVYLVYTDDVNMLGENLQTIRENIEILINASKDIGLEVISGNIWSHLANNI